MAGNTSLDLPMGSARSLSHLDFYIFHSTSIVLSFNHLQVGAVGSPVTREQAIPAKVVLHR